LADVNLLDLLYGKNRPPAVSAADMQAKMQALADDANRKAAEMEKEDSDRKRDRVGRRK
jgi:hypothetical protein